MVLAAFATACQQPPSGPSDPGAGASGNGAPSPPVQVPQVAGDYTLTIGGGICRWAPLPPDLTLRTYRAVLQQQGGFLALSFSGVTFEGHPSGTSPTLTGQLHVPTGVATFELPKPDLGWWNEWETVWAPVTEVLSDGSRIQVYGAVRATVEPSGLSGTFQGTFVYSPSSPQVRSGSCESDQHRFTLAR
jgi:hypothetical protein